MEIQQVTIYPNPKTIMFQRLPNSRIIENIFSDENGVQVKYIGHPFPENMLVYPEVQDMVGTLKRLFWDIITDPFLLAYYLLNKNARAKIDLNVCMGLRHFLLSEEGFSQKTRELRRAGKMFFNLTLVDLLSMVFEYDDAYRYRIMDFFNEFKKEKFLDNPKREINRMFYMVNAREHCINYKYKDLYKIFSFLFPFIKKTIIGFIRELDVNKLKMTDADFYWSLEKGFDTKGIKVEDRLLIKSNLQKI